MTKGLYIVFEGAGATGKTTQIHLLAQRLRSQGFAVRVFREPDSQTDLTARSIRLLTQDPHYPMNTKTEVLLYNAARSQSLEVIRAARDNGLICLVDRSFLSTLVFQYYGRNDIPDYKSISNIINFAVGDMHPNITFVFDAPADILIERIKKRGQGERFDNPDIAFMNRIRAGYLIEAKARKYQIIDASKDPDKIHEKIWAFLHGKPLPEVKAAGIPYNSKIPQQEQAVAQPLLKKTNTGLKITPAGKDYLKDAITNVNSNVYAFKTTFNPLTAAAAMARLSRRFNDLRVTILDEFSGTDGENEALLKRVITAYGDDSVQQLIGDHIVVEGASNLLTKKIEWGRLAAYLEQSTRYIYYDQKDENGHYKYYVPANFNKRTSQLYIRSINKIFDKYSEMVHSLTKYISDNSEVPQKDRDGAWMAATRAQACDAIRYVLPVATKSTVGIYASGQAIESLIMRLLADELPEARETGQKILKEAREVIPAFLERADKPDRGGANIAYHANRKLAVKKLANKLLPGKYSSDNQKIDLIDVWPHNELDIVADMMYEYSNLSLAEIRKKVDKMSYKQKTSVFKAYIGERLNRRQKPGRAFEKIHYSWDIICDYGIFRDLQRHRMVEDLAWQPLSPRYGYDIPELVEKASLSEAYLDCFDISIELFGKLQTAGYHLEAQYATLLGHKLRWKVSYNAREAFHLHELRTVPQGHPGYRKLVYEMHEKITAIHPLTAEAMIFVNKDETPELNRLAAEKYTQYKLKILDKK
jgi:dTMP kinase